MPLLEFQQPFDDNRLAVPEDEQREVRDEFLTYVSNLLKRTRRSRPEMVQDMSNAVALGLRRKDVRGRNIGIFVSRFADMPTLATIDLQRESYSLLGRRRMRELASYSLESQLWSPVERSDLGDQYAQTKIAKPLGKKPILGPDGLPVNTAQDFGEGLRNDREARQLEKDLQLNHQPIGMLEFVHLMDFVNGANPIPPHFP